LLILSNDRRVDFLSEALRESGEDAYLLTTDELLRSGGAETSATTAARRAVLTSFLNEHLSSLRPDVLLIDASVTLKPELLSLPKETISVLLDCQEPFWEEEYAPYAGVCTAFFTASETASRKAELAGFRKTSLFFIPAEPSAFEKPREDDRSFYDFLVLGRYTRERESILLQLRGAGIVNSAVCGKGWFRARRIPSYIRRQMNPDLPKSRNPDDSAKGTLRSIAKSRLVVYETSSDGGLAPELFDAAALRSPILARRTEEVLREFGEDGVRTFQSYEEAVAEAKTMLAFELGAEKMVETARKIAEVRFTPKARAEQLLDLLDEL